MADKRMRPLIKEEPGVCGAQEAQQQQAAAAERDGRLRRVEEEGAGGAGLELQLLSANA